jgi:hypothetical protein
MAPRASWKGYLQAEPGELPGAALPGDERVRAHQRSTSSTRTPTTGST